MIRAVARLWCSFLVVGVSALLAVVLLVSGPATAQTTTTLPTTSGGTTSPYGPATAPSTIAPTTVAPVTKPAAVAFTGADIAGMVGAGAIAIGVGGTLVLVSRRRRSEQTHQA